MKLLLVLAFIAYASAASLAMCNDFCTNYQASCNGINAIYASYTADTGACQAECLAWPDISSSGCPATTVAQALALNTNSNCTGGNSWQCRAYHLGVSGTNLTTLAPIHCLHATPIGENASNPNAYNLAPCAASTNGPNQEKNSLLDDLCNNLLQTCPLYGTVTDMNICRSSFHFGTTGRTDQSWVPLAHNPPVTGDTTYPLTAQGSANNVACRRYHVTAARTSAATHCPHAALGAGVCGTSCDFFCNIVMGACTGSNAAYPNMAACSTACGGFMMLNSTTTVSSGDSFDCRLYHAGVASQGGASAVTHCPHTMVKSATCGGTGGTASGLSANFVIVAFLAALALFL